MRKRDIYRIDNPYSKLKERFQKFQKNLHLQNQKLLEATKHPLRIKNSVKLS